MDIERAAPAAAIPAGPKRRTTGRKDNVDPLGKGRVCPLERALLFLALGFSRGDRIGALGEHALPSVAGRAGIGKAQCRP